MQLFRPHVRPADSPPLGLRQKGAGGFCQHLHPVVLKIRVPGPVGTGEQQDEIVVPVVKEAHPPHHVRAVHVPGFDEFRVRHGGRIPVSPGMGHLVQVLHRLLHHSAEQVLFPLVPLIQRPSGDAGPFTDGLEGSLFKSVFQKLLPGTLKNPWVNGMIRHCHNISPSHFDNLITDNLVINISQTNSFVKG